MFDSKKPDVFLAITTSRDFPVVLGKNLASSTGKTREVAIGIFRFPGPRITKDLSLKSKV